MMHKGFVSPPLLLLVSFWQRLITKIHLEFSYCLPREVSVQTRSIMNVTRSHTIFRLQSFAPKGTRQIRHPATRHNQSDLNCCQHDVYQAMKPRSQEADLPNRETERVVLGTRIPSSSGHTKAHVMHVGEQAGMGRAYRADTAIHPTTWIRGLELGNVRPIGAREASPHLLTERRSVVADTHQVGGDGDLRLRPPCHHSNRRCVYRLAPYTSDSSD
jgi:hypothetical protein